MQALWLIKILCVFAIFHQAKWTNDLVNLAHTYEQLYFVGFYQKSLFLDVSNVFVALLCYTIQSMRVFCKWAGGYELSIYDAEVAFGAKSSFCTYHLK